MSITALIRRDTNPSKPGRAPGLHTTAGQRVLGERDDLRRQLAALREQLDASNQLHIAQNARIDELEHHLAGARQDHAAAVRKADETADILQRVIDANDRLAARLRELEADRANRRAVTLDLGAGSSIPKTHDVMETQAMDQAAILRAVSDTQPIPLHPAARMPGPSNVVTLRTAAHAHGGTIPPGGAA